jgi:putative PIN family toxin of toxin-antitoxin system
MSPRTIPRVVFDTNTVVSALLFSGGRLAWLISHWQEGNCVPLLSRMTAAEITRVLGYPKFRLSSEDRLELLGDYLPHCETIEHIQQCPLACRDTKDQMFLDLAQSGRADVLVSGDQDLLALAGRTAFLIETPENYRRRTHGTERIP